MSKAYFASDWTTLEHHSLLFRDPTNEQRRFVPLLLEDCERPAMVAQFLHIDWRKREDSAYTGLVGCCRQTRNAEQEPHHPEAQASAASEADISIATPEAHDGSAWSVAVSRDGKYIVSGGSEGDCTLKVWDLEEAKVLATLEGHSGGILSVAVTDKVEYAISGSRDKTIKI